MKAALLEKKKHVKVEIEKNVPKVVQSAKYIMAEKKTLKFIDPITGEEMTMDEALNRSKEGGAKGTRK
jgi:ribosomal protein L30E